MSHKGVAFVDVISHCVTFNNNKGSTKAYDYVRDHILVTGKLDFVPEQEEISIDYAEGEQKIVELFDGHFFSYYSSFPISQNNVIS